MRSGDHLNNQEPYIINSKSFNLVLIHGYLDEILDQINLEADSGSSNLCFMQPYPEGTHIFFKSPTDLSKIKKIFNCNESSYLAAKNIALRNHVNYNKDGIFSEMTSGHLKRTDSILLSEMIVSALSYRHKKRRHLNGSSDLSNAHELIAAHSIIGLMNLSFTSASGIDHNPDLSPRALKMSQSVHRIISSRFMESDLSLSKIAREIGVSERYIQIILSKTNINFSSQLLATRLNYAYSLLSSIDAVNLSIGDISFDCGFNSQSYFNRVFKGYFGLKPSEVRKS